MGVLKTIFGLVELGTQLSEEPDDGKSKWGIVGFISAIISGLSIIFGWEFEAEGLFLGILLLLSLVAFVLGVLCSFAGLFKYPKGYAITGLIVCLFTVFYVVNFVLQNEKIL